MRNRLFLTVFSLGLLAPIAGCDPDSGDTDDDHGHDHDDEHGHDEHGDEHGDGDGDGDGDLDPEPYMDGMNKAGAHFDVSLTADPAPPAMGESTWTLEINHHMAAAEGLSVEVTPFMPAHGHGSDEVTVSDDGEGVYTATGVNLFMEGVWDTTVKVSSDEHEDEFHFVFEVQE